MKEFSWQTIQRFDKKQMIKTDPCMNVELIRLGSAPPYRRIVGVPPSQMLPNLSTDSPRIFQVRQDKRLISRKPIAQTLKQPKQKVRNASNFNNEKHQEVGENISKLSDNHEPEGEEVLKSFHEILNNNYASENKKKQNLSRALNVYITSPVGNNNKDVQPNKNIFQPQNSKTRTERLMLRPNERLRISGTQLHSRNNITLRISSNDRIPVKDDEQSPANQETFQENTASSMETNSGDDKATDWLSMSFDQAMGDRVTLADYCKLENERYLVDYKAIKTILFHRWLGHSESYIGNYQPINDVIADDIEYSENSNNELKSDG